MKYPLLSSFAFGKLLNMIAFRVGPNKQVQYAIVADNESVGTWMPLTNVTPTYQLLYFLWRQGAQIDKPTPESVLESLVGDRDNA